MPRPANLQDLPMPLSFSSWLAHRAAGTGAAFEGLPEGLSLSMSRRPPREAWMRDETVVGPDGKAFAAAFDIHEVSNGNDVGGLCWGVLEGSRPRVLGEMPPFYICCWTRPFAFWVTPTVFVVKLSRPGLDWPLLAIHPQLGSQLLRITGLRCRPADATPEDLPDPALWAPPPP